MYNIMGALPSERKGPSPVMGSQVNGDGFKVCVVYWWKKPVHMVLCDKPTTHSELTCRLGVTTIPSSTHTGITLTNMTHQTVSTALLCEHQLFKAVVPIETIEDGCNLNRG